MLNHAESGRSMAKDVDKSRGSQNCGAPRPRRLGRGRARLLSLYKHMPIEFDRGWLVKRYERTCEAPPEKKLGPSTQSHRY